MRYTFVSWPKTGIPGGFHAPTLDDRDGTLTFEKMSFKRHSLRGGNESILNGLEPALGLALLGVWTPGRN